MSKISQQISFEIAQPGVTWRQDIALPEPLLRFPLDESRFCPQMYLLSGFSAGLTLYWTAIPGATFYVVQLGDNSSFTGPNVKGLKTSDTEIELNYIEHLRVSDQFFWRVAAYNNTGGVSVMSEVRSIKIACPETQGVSFNNENRSLYADIDSPQICDTTGVNIELGGPDWVRKTDGNRTWVLNVNYDCDSFEGHEVSISDVIWEIRQSPSSPVTVSEDTNDHIKLDISAYDEEWFEIVAHVIFELTGVGFYECKAHKKILIEGDPIGGGGSELVRFRISNICPGLNPGFWCSCYEAVVLFARCGSDIQAGDTIRVFDPLDCWFNMPSNLLYDRVGTAVLYQASAIADGTNCSTVLVESENECIWVVESLCCIEDVYA